MKIVEPKQRFIIGDLIYVMSRKHKKIEIGSILFDSRKESFVEIESKDDVLEYDFVDPELYMILKQVGKIGEWGF